MSGQADRLGFDPPPSPEASSHAPLPPPILCPPLTGGCGPGVMYICGVPGTGKTATVTEVLKGLRGTPAHKTCQVQAPPMTDCTTVQPPCSPLTPAPAPCPLPLICSKRCQLPVASQSGSPAQPEVLHPAGHFNHPPHKACAAPLSTCSDETRGVLLGLAPPACVAPTGLCCVRTGGDIANGHASAGMRGWGGLHGWESGRGMHG